MLNRIAGGDHALAFESVGRGCCRADEVRGLQLPHHRSLCAPGAAGPRSACRRRDRNLTGRQVLGQLSTAQVFQDSFDFTAAPGLSDDELGAVAVGFGPDVGDRTLTYAYITGDTSSQWTGLVAPRGC